MGFFKINMADKGLLHDEEGWLTRLGKGVLQLEDAGRDRGRHIAEGRKMADETGEWRIAGRGMMEDETEERRIAR